MLSIFNTATPVLSADEDGERGSGRLEPIDILSGVITFKAIDNVTWDVYFSTPAKTEHLGDVEHDMFGWIAGSGIYQSLEEAAIALRVSQMKRSRMYREVAA